jgi:hypothetical protein
LKGPPAGSRFGDGNVFSVNSTHPVDKQASPRISKGGIVFMLIILLSMALLAIFANIQHFRRDKIETVIVKPANPR